MKDSLPLNEKLKQLRLQKALTQKEVADNIGMSYRTYQHYEAGTRNPSSKALRALAEFFEVSIPFLKGNTQLAELAHYSTVKDAVSSKFRDKLNSIQICYDNLSSNHQLEPSMTITELIRPFCMDNDKERDDLFFHLRNIIDYSTRYHIQKDAYAELSNNSELNDFDKEYIEITNQYIRSIKAISEKQAQAISDIKSKV